MMKKSHLTELMAALAIAFTLTGCDSDVLFGSNRGRMRVVLSADNGSAISGAYAAGAVAASQQVGAATEQGDSDDDSRPSWWFQSANVVLSSVLARNQDGVLVNVDMELPVAVDVVKIEGGKEVQLPDGVLPAALYDQVVVVMTAVQGVTHDGTMITIEPAGGGWTAVVPICPLEVVEGETATVGIKLMVRNSFLQTGHKWEFQPRFRPVHDCTDDNEGDG